MPEKLYTKSQAFEKGLSNQNEIRRYTKKQAPMTFFREKEKKKVLVWSHENFQFPAGTRDCFRYITQSSAEQLES